MVSKTIDYLRARRDWRLSIGASTEDLAQFDDRIETLRQMLSAPLWLTIDRDEKPTLHFMQLADSGHTSKRSTLGAFVYQAINVLCATGRDVRPAKPNEAWSPTAQEVVSVLLDLVGMTPSRPTLAARDPGMGSRDGDTVMAEYSRQKVQIENGAYWLRVYDGAKVARPPNYDEIVNFLVTLHSMQLSPSDRAGIHLRRELWVPLSRITDRSPASRA